MSIRMENLKNELNEVLPLKKENKNQQKMRENIIQLYTTLKLSFHGIKLLYGARSHQVHQKASNNELSTSGKKRKKQE